MTLENRPPLPARVWNPVPFGIGLVVLLSGYVLGWFASRTDPRTDGEWRLDHWFSLHRSPVLDSVARALELIDGPLVAPWLMLATGVILILARRRVMGLAAMLMTFLGWFPGHLAKMWFHRSRPPQDVQPIVVYHDTLSYPSGHTGLVTAAVVFWLFAATLWRRRRAWMVVLGALAVVVVGISRLYAGAHFLFDVVGGALLAGGASVMLWPAFAELWVRGQRGGGFWAEPAYRLPPAERKALRSPGEE